LRSVTASLIELAFKYSNAAGYIRCSFPNLPRPSLLKRGHTRKFRASELPGHLMFSI
jgi:hypothetical protein